MSRIGLAPLALVVATIVVISVGQIMFKRAAVSIDFSDVRTLLSARLLLALVIYGAATVMWMAVLSRVPLTVAFPFYGLTFLLVPLLAWWFLGEALRWPTLVGGLVIMLGVGISVYKWS